MKLGRNETRLLLKVGQVWCPSLQKAVEVIGLDIDFVIKITERLSHPFLLSAADQQVSHSLPIR